MKSRKSSSKPLAVTKRGRPVLPDRTILKARTMTVCLTTELHKQLQSYAAANKQKVAAMARILIESGMQGMGE